MFDLLSREPVAPAIRDYGPTGSDPQRTYFLASLGADDHISNRGFTTLCGSAAEIARRNQPVGYSWPSCYDHHGYGGAMIMDLLRFLIDALLASLPFFDSNRIHGPYFAFAIYALVLWLLRFADNRAVKRGWPLWVRITLKVVIVVGAEALVSLSGLEKCNIQQTACHRVFF